MINEICSEFKSGKNIKADSISENGEYPVFGGNGLRGYTASYNHEGLYVLIGRQGALCGNVRSVNGKTYITEHAIAAAGNEKSNTSFLHYLFLKMNLGQYSDQSAQPGLAVNKLLKLKVSLPPISEQEKIAKLLSLLDERIATQNKIIDKLQSLIKGIAQKIVHSNKPNVRLSECLECKSSTLQESEVCEQGTYPVYGANGIVGYLDNYNTESEAVYIIKDGSGVGTVSYVTGKCSATGTLNTLQAKEGYSLHYLYYLLKVFNFEPYKTGMAIPHIYFKDYGKAKVFCPSYTEQLQYARLLSAIDNKLSIEQNILTELSLQKQCLLRQMFI
ncbi:restriction endonuclease subunit S [Bacteroides vulgatus]|uniref:Restriction endonuclease subunit S n=1 Tax=Phocaeicola vulgatus TaxID=821 RepID=A0A7Y6PCL7_PHOVU|nr:restriction endonuclease subunit S [Phocaeicola vulgatus]